MKGEVKPFPTPDSPNLFNPPFVNRKNLFFERISPFQKSLRGYVLWGLFGLKWTLSTLEILTETQFFL